MGYFNNDFLNFFKNLSQNNNKLWFDENRKIYETEVKKPFYSFINEMIMKIQEFEPEIKINPADAIFRINNDIRFSKEKTPYKTHVGANISKFGRKDKSYPGFYFQFSYDKIMIYGGAYMLETPVLQKIREHIAENLEEFQSAYTDKTFKKYFGKILGEQNKRLPANLQQIIEKEPLIANKQFYYGAELSAKIILKPELPDILMEYYHAGRNINSFLRDGF